MKRQSMIVVTLMVLMAITTPLLAGERDARDLSYLNSSPVVTAPNQVASMTNDKRDARDLSYLNSSDIYGVSSQQIAVQGDNDRRDARDLAYLFGNSKGNMMDEPNNVILQCCQR
jgi:hypothetical protein